MTRPEHAALPGKILDRLRTTFLEVVGIGGSVAPSRYVGATTSGTPTSGTFAKGDWGVSHDGTVWVCRVAGVAGSTAAFSSTVTNNLSQTVSGTKTFSAAPVVPSLVINGHVVTCVGGRMYLDGTQIAFVSELSHNHDGTYAPAAHAH